LGGNTTEHVEGTAVEPCAAKQDRYQARHWFTCHVIHELKRIESSTSKERH
jgi:hypothetical protein